MNYNIAVVDDKRQDSEKLQRNIHMWFNEHNSPARNVTCFNDGQELLNDFEPEKYNIIFMDIIMNSLNGIETVQRLRDIDDRVLVIFTTSSGDYALDACTLHPFDYIVKPYNSERLGRVLAEAVKFLDPPDERLTVQVSRSRYAIPLRKISAVSSKDHFVELVMTEGNCLLCSMKFRDVEAGLSGDKRFLECNRGIIINMDCVSSLSREKDSFIMMDGTHYPIRTRDRKSIIDTFTQYQISRMRRRGGKP